MVELWRFHQPAIVRDSEPSAKIFAITAKPIDEGFPLFFFFLFFFLLLQCISRDIINRLLSLFFFSLSFS